MSLVKQHFYAFYSLVNIHSYFIRTVQVKYWSNNLDIFESDGALIRSPGRAWGATNSSFFKPEHEGLMYGDCLFSFLDGLSVPTSSGQASASDAVLCKAMGRGRCRSSSGAAERRETGISLTYWAEPASLRCHDIKYTDSVAELLVF